MSFLSGSYCKWSCEVIYKRRYNDNDIMTTNKLPGMYFVLITVIFPIQNQYKSYLIKNCHSEIDNGAPMFLRIKRSIPQHEKICRFCQVHIANEFHFLFVCKHSQIAALRHKYVPRYYTAIYCYFGLKFNDNTCCEVIYKRRYNDNDIMTTNKLPGMYFVLITVIFPIQNS
jgi:hypothetical protein